MQYLLNLLHFLKRTQQRVVLINKYGIFCLLDNLFTFGDEFVEFQRIVQGRKDIFFILLQ